MTLNNFLNPKYIAVIGASSDPNKVGRKVFDNIRVDYKSKVFPINNNDSKIAGVTAYTDISLIPIKDWSKLLVVIVIPAKFVLSEIKKCAELEIKNIIIISAGFKEIGSDGKKIEEDIKEVANKYKMNILGPNCLGFINTINPLNATFSDYQANKKGNKKNNIAFLSQSGAIGSAVLDWLVDKNIGLSYFISLGNKAVLNENDFFNFFSHDKKTDLIIAYLEEISQGPKFLELVSKLSKIKPVAILKSGRTIMGSQMASSHTGSLAGSYDITLTALRRCGAIVLDNINEIYNLMRLIDKPVNNINTEGDLAIVSNAGGLSVVAADAVFDNKVDLTNLSKNITDQLQKILPNFACLKNPLDILGDADPDRYKKTLEIILNDKKVSSVLVLLTPQSMTDVEETAKVIVQLKKKFSNKIIVTCFLGGAEVLIGKKILDENSIANFESVEESIIILSKFLKYLKNRKDIKPFVPFKEEVNFSNKSPELMDYIESFKLLKKYNIDSIIPKKITTNTIKLIKYPIAVKFVGPDFVHKTDKKAIFLNVKNEDELTKIITIFNISKKGDNNYIIYQPMFKIDMELILGLKRDPVFGPIILLGLGGIYTEVYKDSVLELADLTKERALKMIKKLKVYPILAGVRSNKGIDLNKLSDIILKFAKLIKENKNILEIDINPLSIDSKKIIAIDVRIMKK
jgi:acetyltransferase